MSKNKYKTEGATTTGAASGERKHRDHTKSGKLARRRETRQLEAIARQVKRIQAVEAAIKGGPADADIVKYISAYENPADAVAHSKLTLQKIRGGTPQAVLVARTETDSPLPVVVITEEKPKNKYKKRKAAAPQKNDEGGTTPPVAGTAQ